MTFRIEVCATSEHLGVETISAVRTAAEEAGAAGLIEVAHHSHHSGGPALTLVVASDGPPNDQMVTCTKQAIADEQIVIPVVDDSRLWYGRLPLQLQQFNAVDLLNADAGRHILEASGVLTPLRGVFLSHRRTDGAALAMQLASELRKYGIGTFVDVLDILPANPVQERILGALDQMACLVLLESPDALGSEWVGKEVVYAQERHLGTLSICWAEEDVAGTSPKRFSQFNSNNRVDVRSFLNDDRQPATLSSTGVDIVVRAILHEFTQALYFRRLNLKRELMAAFPDIQQIKPWLFSLQGKGGRRLIGLSPYRPDAVDLHSIAIARHAERVTDAMLVHHPITADAVEARMLAWIGQKGPELAVGIDEIVGLISTLEESS